MNVELRELKSNKKGALAQLGAHNTGSVGVRGSNPLCSTKKEQVGRLALFFCPRRRLGIYIIAERSDAELYQFKHTPQCQIEYV